MLKAEFFHFSLTMLSSLLISEPTSNWSYKAEGNANVVFSYVGNASALVGKVLKVRKLNIKTRSRLSPEYQLLPHDPWDFAENIMSPLLGESYSSVGERVYVPRQFLRKLNDFLKETPHRSFSRKEQDIDTMFPYVIIMEDRTLLTKAHVRNTSKKGKEVISFGVEIKPKCGNLPYTDEVALYKREQQYYSNAESGIYQQIESFCTTVVNYSCSDIGYDEVHYRCRFCMQQVQKSLRHRQEVQDFYDCVGDDPTPISADTSPSNTTPDNHSDYSPRSTSSPCSSVCSSECTMCDFTSLDIHFPPPESLSRYCPLDLFSLDYGRMLKAVSGLFLTPQNNFRVFLNHHKGTSGSVKKAARGSYFSTIKTQSKGLHASVKELYGEDRAVGSAIGCVIGSADVQHGASDLLDPVLAKLAQLPLFKSLQRLEKLHCMHLDQYQDHHQHHPHHPHHSHQHETACLLGWLQIDAGECTAKIPYPHTEAVFAKHPPTVTDADGVTTALPHPWFSTLSGPHTDADAHTHTHTRSVPSELIALLFLITNVLRSTPILPRIRAVQALDRGLLGGIGSGGPQEAAAAVEKIASIMQTALPSLEKQPLSLSDHTSFLEIEALLSCLLHAKDACSYIAAELAATTADDATTAVTTAATAATTPMECGNPSCDEDVDTGLPCLGAVPNQYRKTNLHFVKVLVESLRQWRRRVSAVNSSPVGGDSPLFAQAECDLSPDWLEDLQAELEKHCSDDEIQTLQTMAMSLVSFMISATAKDCSILIALEGTSSSSSLAPTTVTTTAADTAADTAASMSYRQEKGDVANPGGTVESLTSPKHGSPPSKEGKSQTRPPITVSASTSTPSLEHRHPAHEGKHPPSDHSDFTFSNNTNSHTNHADQPHRSENRNSDNAYSDPESCTITFIPNFNIFPTNFPGANQHCARVSIANQSVSSQKMDSVCSPPHIASNESTCLSRLFPESLYDSFIALSLTSVHFHFSLGVVDLDPKPLHRIPKYKVQDEVIRSLWISAVKHWTSNSEP